MYALHGVAHLLTAPPPEGPEPLAARAANLAAYVLAAVVSEALWTVRPWAARAVAALGAAVIARMFAVVGPDVWGPLIAAVVTVRFTFYVGNQVRAFYGVGAAPRPVAVHLPSPPRP
jgi:hypothetical protein